MILCLPFLLSGKTEAAVRTRPAFLLLPWRTGTDKGDREAPVSLGEVY